MSNLSDAITRINKELDSPVQADTSIPKTSIEQDVADFKNRLQAFKTAAPETAPQEEVGLLGALPKGLWKGATETLPTIF